MVPQGRLYSFKFPNKLATIEDTVADEVNQASSGTMSRSTILELRKRPLPWVSQTPTPGDSGTDFRRLRGRSYLRQDNELDTRAASL